MSYRLDQTDFDSVSRQASNLNLVPMHTFPVLVEPPSQDSSLHYPIVAETDLVGGYILSWGTRFVTIAEELHDSLLEQSLREYDELWRRLAQK